MAPLVGQAHYSGIRAIFPINTEIVSMAKTSELDRASKNLDKLYDQLMKKARKLMLHKTKVAVAAKTIVYSISVLYKSFVGCIISQKCRIYQNGLTLIP